MQPQLARTVIRRAAHRGCRYASRAWSPALSAGRRQPAAAFRRRDLPARRLRRRSPRFAACSPRSTAGRPAMRCYHPSYDTDRVVRAVWLADLYVESWARGRGLGRRLAAKVASLRRGRGRPRPCIGACSGATTPARRFYAPLRQRGPALLHCPVPRRQRCQPGRRQAALAAAVLRPPRPADAPLLGRLLNATSCSPSARPHFDFDAGPRLAADGFGAAPRSRPSSPRPERRRSATPCSGRSTTPRPAAPFLFSPTSWSRKPCARPRRGRGPDGRGRAAGRRPPAISGMVWEVLEGNGTGAGLLSPHRRGERRGARRQLRRRGFPPTGRRGDSARADSSRDSRRRDPSRDAGCRGRWRRRRRRPARRSGRAPGPRWHSRSRRRTGGPVYSKGATRETGARR